MSLASRLDEMVTLYTVSGLTVRQIAGRYGAAPATVKLMLMGAGVALTARPPKSATSLAQPRQRTRRAPRLSEQSARSITRLDVEAEADLLGSNARHVRAVVGALGGKGFPFLVFGAAR
jgi:transposase-like protein